MKKAFDPTPNQQTLLLVTCVTLGAIIGARFKLFSGIEMVTHESHLTNSIIATLTEMALIPFFLLTAMEVKGAILNSPIRENKRPLMSAIVSFTLPIVALYIGLDLVGYSYPIAGVVAAPTDIILALAFAQMSKEYISKTLIKYLLLAAVADDLFAALLTPFLSGEISHLYSVAIFLLMAVLIMYSIRNTSFIAKKSIMLVFVVLGLLLVHISPLLTSVALVFPGFSKAEVHHAEHDPLLKVLSFLGIGAFAFLSLDTHNLSISSLISFESLIVFLSGILAVFGFYIILAFSKHAGYGNQLKRLATSCFAGICMTMSLYFVDHFDSNILSESQINSFRVGILGTSGLFVVLGLLFARLSGKLPEEEIED